jgi:hypothetical protein
VTAWENLAAYRVVDMVDHIQVNSGSDAISSAPEPTEAVPLKQSEPCMSQGLVALNLVYDSLCRLIAEAQWCL